MELLGIIVIVFLCSVGYSLYSTRKQIKQRRIELEKSFGLPPSYRTDLESVTTYWAQHAASNGLDDITWNDLDMDDVFHRINVCQTSIGEELLYTLLRKCEPVPENWEDYLKAIRRDKESRVNLQSLLSQLGKAPYSGLTAFLSGTTLVKTPSHGLVTLLGLLPVLSLLSMFVIGYAGLLLAFVSGLGNMIYSVYFKQKVQSSYTGMRYLSKMLWCSSKISAMTFEGLEPLFAQIRELNKIFKPLKSRLSSVAAETMSANMADMMAEYARWFMLTDVRGYAKSAAILLKNKKEAMALYEKIGQLDTLITVCSFRKSLGVVCAPEFHDAMHIQMERMGHPLLTRPVENTCDLKRDTLITGSNASGKSTFIKAVAVNAVLGQALNTCAAKSFKLPRSLIISSMALRDSILKGDSYFVAEIKSFRRIMDAARQRPCLCFIDEILRGTNTIERIAASAAVLYSLSRENCLCLVASHDIELTRILKNEYDNYHFAETVSDAGVTFDYTLKPGPSRTRNAILLLSTMGFDAAVIQKAHELVGAFETTNTWPAFMEAGGHDDASRA